MPFYMPTVDLNRLSQVDQELMTPLIELGRLTTCPKWNTNTTSKLIHHYLLRHLYKDPRWCVPLHHAWYMPHLDRNPGDREWVGAERMAIDIIESGCFGSPQPVLIDWKTYQITNDDGSTFILKVN